MKTTQACRSRSLFRALSWGLFWTLAVQITLALGLVLVLVLWPLTQQSAQAKAGLMVLAVQTLLELPQGTRADFVAELSARHGLELRVGCDAQPQHDAPWASYPTALQRALIARMQGMGDSAPTVSISSDKQSLMSCVWLNGQAFELRFAAPHFLESRLWALGLILLGSSLLAGALAWVLARRVARPLEGMTRTVQTWSEGAATDLPVGTKDVFELCTLARTLEQMRRSLYQHEQARSTLLAGVSHDLRTPLARMRLAVEMLPEAASMGLHAGLVRDIAAMEGLIAQTLQLARAQAQAAEWVDVCALAAEWVGDQQRGGVAVSLAGAPSCHALVAPLALERIVVNLIDNAWRYSGHKPVEVVLHCADDTWRIEVLDRGPGIPESMRERVFQPFTRLEPSRNLATGGSGLGLAIVHQLAETQGWAFGIETRTGGGSCVWVASA